MKVYLVWEVYRYSDEEVLMGIYSTLARAERERERLEMIRRRESYGYRVEERRVYE